MLCCQYHSGVRHAFSITGFIKKQVVKAKDTLMEGKKQIDGMLDEPIDMFNWEPSDYVEFCRDCHVKFGPTLWKHHCRSCGGVFCEGCTKVIW